MPRLKGEIERVAPGHIAGWAADLASNQPVRVSAYLDDAVLASAAEVDGSFTLRLARGAPLTELRVQAEIDDETFVLAVAEPGWSLGPAREALRAEAHEDWPTAVAHWRALIAEDATNLVAWLGLARAAMLASEFIVATASLRVARGLATDDRQRREVAQKCLALGQPRAAVELLAGLVRDAPTNDGLALEHAAALLRVPNPKAAVQVLTALLARTPDHPQASALLAEALWAIKDTAGAEELLRKRLLQPAPAPDTRRSLARLLAATARVDEATILVADEPALVGTLRGEAQLAAKQVEDAEVSFRAALMIDPQHLGALLGLASVELAKHAPKRAWDLLRIVLAREPLHAEALMLAARCAEAQREWHVAARLLALLTHTEPGDGTPGIRLTRLLLARGAAEEALQICRQALKVHPSRFHLALNFGIALAKIDGIAAALEWIAQSPMFRGASRLTEALFNLHRACSDAATDAMLPSLVLAEWPEVEPALTVLDQLRRSGIYPAACAWVEALAAHPAAHALTSDQWRHIGEVARRAGNESLAERCLDAAIAQVSDHKALPGLAKSSLTPAQQERLLPTISSWIATESRIVHLHLARLRLLVALGQLEEAVLASRAMIVEHPASTPALSAALAVELLHGESGRAGDYARNSKLSDPDGACDCAELLAEGLRSLLRTNNQLRVERILTDVSALALELVTEAGRATPAATSLLSFATRYRGLDEPLPILRRAIELAERDASALVALLAGALERAGYYGDALAVLNSLPGQTADRLLAKARLARVAGQMEEALAQYASLPEAQRQRDTVLESQSELLRLAGQDAAAEALLRRLLTVTPLLPRRIRALGDVLMKAGRLEAELAKLGTVLQRFPDDFETRTQLGLLLFEAGRLAEADAVLAQLVGDPRYGIALLEQHVMLRLLRMDYAGARTVIEASGLGRSSNPDVARSVAGLMARLTDRAEAQSVLRTALTANPANVPLILALAEQLIEAGTDEGLLVLIRRAVAIDPLNAHAHLLLGITLQRTGDVQGARVALFTARMLSPGYVRLYAQLGLLEEESDDIDAALAAYGVARRAAAGTGKDPGARVLWHSVMCHMLRSEWQEAITAHADLCTLFDQAFPGSMRVWRGESLHGQRLLVGMRGGPGDELRVTMVCCPWLIRSGAQVTFACDPRLTTLLSRTFPEIDFIPVHSGHRRLRRRDGDVTLISTAWPSVSPRVLEMSIPYDLVDDGGFVCNSDSLIHRVYFEGSLRDGEDIERRLIKTDPGRRAEARRILDALPAGLRVGLCWRGSYSSGYRQRGFLQAEELGPFLAVEGTRFVNLQVNLTHAEQEVFQGNLAVIPGLDLFDDFEGTAALIAELDLVISVGVSMRDTAGAVGVPVWSFTTWPGAADVWRSGPDGVDVWQPSIIHYDLHTYGSRAGIISAIARDLTGLSRRGWGARA
ncbi:tetratricopeptide repeat protein [Sediminicoccus rosea]|uniref:Tetratricopeptide repeat protein n=1 Tax=Sediminicoccus rosea TaxID=1225128 RepID=A0ABZ0PQB5_9PROT|nr:tetratricopeptide repeat protein [Sediminicoccus rosea]WPB87458.1 tetratricopeptide repeat protein [Sediminicoccus rosea]